MHHMEIILVVLKGSLGNTSLVVLADIIDSTN